MYRIVGGLCITIVLLRTAWLKNLDQTGIKWVSGFPSNMQKRFPTIAGLIVLNDIDTGKRCDMIECDLVWVVSFKNHFTHIALTGFPTAIMDGTYITAIRTAAVSGVSVKYLARKDSEVLAIVGTGVQGKYNALCITNALPSINRIRIYDKYEPSIKSFIEQVGSVLGDKVKIEVVGSAEDAFSGADVVVTATAKLLEPVFFDKWVKPGALVLPIHAGGWNPEILTAMDKVVVDDWAQFCAFTKKIYKPLPQPFAEVGEIVAGQKPGRQNDQETIINFNVGLAIHDIVVGSRVLEKAKEMGIGVELEFIDLSSPIGLPPVS